VYYTFESLIPSTEGLRLPGVQHPAGNATCYHFVTTCSRPYTTENDRRHVEGYEVSVER